MAPSGKLYPTTQKRVTTTFPTAMLQVPQQHAGLEVVSSTFL